MEVWRVLPECPEWSGPGQSCRGARGIQGIGTYLGRTMQKRSAGIWSLVNVGVGRAGEQRAASPDAVEDLPPARSRGFVEASGRRRRSLQAELIGQQRRQFWCDEIGFLYDSHPDTWIGEAAMTSH